MEQTKVLRLKTTQEDGVIIDTDKINLPFALAQNSLLTEMDVKEITYNIYARHRSEKWQWKGFSVYKRD